MSPLGYIWINILQTLLRVLPFPSRTGLVKIGRPGRNSPVFLTCNFGLTVARVRHALEGIDAYLLVANSRGVNVWCAATGGLLGNHDVISVLKTSGIGKLVDHREVILPQLAATGIEGSFIRGRTGWNVVWGPVEAGAIPAFLRGKLRMTAEMRTVTFPWTRRLEMAAAWAFPMSLFALLVLPFWPGGVLPLTGFIWAFSLLTFLGFPLYHRHLRSTGRRVGLVLFDFGQRGVPLAIWALFVLALVGHSLLIGDSSWGWILRWALSSLVVVCLLSLDLTGSTPMYKSGLHEDRLLRVVLDPDRCVGVGLCEEVCPREVFRVDRERHQATLSRSEQCVQCGACLVQCPSDAIHFRSPAGNVVKPEVVRRFKLNMLGRRMVTSERSGRATRS